jgi:dTDP-4-amino-4,6-dideoxygalactose transaminase
MPCIKLSSPLIGYEEIEAVTRVLQSHNLNMGRETMLFEEELKSFFGQDDIYVCAVNSGTAALTLALSAYGLGPGDEILVPTYTFVATFQAVSAIGATAIPCDVDVEDAFVNLEDATARLSSRTKAVVPVLYAGCDQQLSRVYDFADQYSLRVVVDAAHSFGTAGIVKDCPGAICFSFDAIKNITCGDGGLIVTKDLALYTRIKDARLLGISGDTAARYKGERTWDPDVTFQGYRFHLNSIAAAIGRAQLSKFDLLKEKRRKYARMYFSGLSGLSMTHLSFFPIEPDRIVPHIFPILVKNQKRNALREFLGQRGIETGVQYKPNHLLSFYNLKYSLVNAETIYHSVLSLPLHPRLDEGDVEYVVESIIEFFH